MTAPAGEMDWDGAERRERRRELLGLPGIAAFFVGMVLVTGGVGFSTGGAAWAVVGVVLGLVVLMTAASHLWAAPFVPLTFLLNAQWDRPVAAATGTVLLVGAGSAWMLWWRRRVLAARRWLADPPGPAREALPRTTAERWLTGRRGLATIVGSALALALIIGLVVAFAARF